MPRLFPSLCVGFLVGGAAGYFLLRPAAPAPAAEAALPAGPVKLSSWSWQTTPTPPSLKRDEAALAVSAWLALHDPSGKPAAYATRAAGLRALLVRLPAEGFPRLLEGLVASKADDDQRLLQIAFSAWTARDPATASLWIAGRLEKNSSDERLFGLAYEALRAWSAKDPEAAASWACALRDDKLARRLAGGPLRSLAEKNPERALALARSRDDDFRKVVLSSVLGPMGKKDPAGTLRTFAPELWKNGDGFYELRDVISSWMKQDGSAALAWLLAQPRDSDRDISNWLANLGDNTPAWRRTVADALVSNAAGSNRSDLMRDLFFRWGNEQPAEALAWLNQLSDPDLRIDLLEKVGNSYYSNNPEKSLPLALAMPEGANRTGRLAQLLGAWAKINSDAALAWMREHSAEPGVSGASYAVHGALLADLAREDPQAALVEWQALSDAKTRDNTIDAIARAWGQKDPAAAFQWAEAQRETQPQRRYGGNSELLYEWAKKDPEAALRWVEDWRARIPENAHHPIDYYFAALGGTWNEKAPRAATADLFTKIKNPAVRVEALSNHVREWLTKDPDAARAWVEVNPALTPADRAKILSSSAK